MSDFKGTLIVEMRFEVPTRASWYQAVLKDKGEVTPDDIILTEEQNYLASPESYLDVLIDNVQEVSFDFVMEKDSGQSRSDD